jgi:hypothetical protein
MNSIIRDLAETKDEYLLLMAYAATNGVLYDNCKTVLSEYRSLPDRGPRDTEMTQTTTELTVHPDARTAWNTVEFLLSRDPKSREQASWLASLLRHPLIRTALESLAEADGMPGGFRASEQSAEEEWGRTER